jgi:hypothetical protein
LTERCSRWLENQRRDIARDASQFSTCRRSFGAATNVSSTIPAVTPGAPPGGKQTWSCQP